MKQFILILNGPQVGGKTSALEMIMKQYKKIFRLSPNKIKFLISDYTPDRDRALVHTSTLLVAEEMLKNGMSILMEGGSMMQGKLNEDLKKLGEKYGIATTTVNIEAPLPKLLDRFNERVMNAPLRDTKLSVTDEAGFMQRYNAYLAIKDQAVQTFDSDTQNPGDIAKQIMDLVQ
jgi:predicted kinase